MLVALSLALRVGWGERHHKQHTQVMTMVKLLRKCDKGPDLDRWIREPSPKK